MLLALPLFGCEPDTLTVKDAQPLVAEDTSANADADTDTDSDADTDADGDGDSDADSDTDADADGDADADTEPSTGDTGSTSTGTTGDTGEPLPSCEGDPPTLVAAVYNWVGTPGEAVQLGDWEGPGRLCSATCDQSWALGSLTIGTDYCLGQQDITLAFGELGRFCVDLSLAASGYTTCTVNTAAGPYYFEIFVP